MTAATPFRNSNRHTMLSFRESCTFSLIVAIHEEGLGMSPNPKARNGAVTSAVLVR
jgi:hypothetical protein